MRPLRLPSAALPAVLSLSAAAWLAATGPGWAADHEIRMLNKGDAGIMVFEPAFLEVAPGDTVHFRAVGKGHDAASIEGMVPEGGPTWKGGLNQDVTVTSMSRASTASVVCPTTPWAWSL